MVLFHISCILLVFNFLSFQLTSCSNFIGLFKVNGIDAVLLDEAPIARREEGQFANLFLFFVAGGVNHNELLLAAILLIALTHCMLVEKPAISCKHGLFCLL